MMMGILCAEQSCISCKCCAIIYDPFHSDDEKLLLWGSFHGAYGALFNIMSESEVLFFVADGYMKL